MAVLLIALYLVWITPLRLSSGLRLIAPGRRVRLRLQVWGVGVPLRLPAHRKKKRRLPGPSALRQALPALKLLLRGLHVRRLEVAVRAGGDAAAAAVLTGLLRTLNGLWPRARLRCDPAFGGESALRARCILDARLGTIGTAALLGAFLLWRARKKEERA